MTKNLDGKPVRIFQLIKDAWTKGLSRQTSSVVGGLFTQATNFDPFEFNQIWQPAMTAQTLSSVGGTTVQFMTPFSASALGYIYAHGAAKLYKIKVSDNSVTDETSNITVGSCKGADVWRSKYLYALDTEVRKIELGAGTDTSLLTGLTSGVPHIMRTGADVGLNEYVTNGALIAKLILETGTAGNILNALTLETGQVAKDLDSDGRYLVIISDNNPSLSPDIKSKCTITFWDMVKSSADQIYRVEDTALIGVKVVNGSVYVFGYDNLWVCNAGTAPVPVYSFTGNATIVSRPSSAAAITVKNGMIYWGANDSTNKIYAYGNLLNPAKKVFFTPYTGSGNGMAIVATTTKFFIGNSAPGIDEVAIGTGVRGSSSLQVAPIPFGRRYQFAYAKAVLKSNLTASPASQALQLVGLNNLDGNGLVTNSENKSFTTDPNRSVLIYYRTPVGSSSDVDFFEQLSAIRLSITQQALISFEIWAYPLEEQYQA